jgi:hypothetical protein
MSSDSVAAPFQCSATAAALASFSTSTGHLKERRSRSPSGSPVHSGSAVPEAYGAVGLHDAGAGHAHRPQGVARDPGAAQQLRDGGPQPLQPLVRRAPSRTSLAIEPSDPAVQVRQQRGDPVRADLQAQQMSGLGPEAEPARGAALAPGPALLGGLSTTSPPR